MQLGFGAITVGSILPELGKRKNDAPRRPAGAENDGEERQRNRLIGGAGRRAARPFHRRGRQAAAL